MRRLALLGLASALLATSGCFARARGEATPAPVKRVAVLPVVSQTWADGHTEPLLAAVETVLAADKRVAVVPRADLVNTLNRPAGAGVLSLLQLGELAPDRPEWAARPLGTLASALSADGVVSIRIDHFERTSEERMTASKATGALTPNRVPVTIVGLSGAMWRAGAARIDWRARYEAKLYGDPAAPGGSAAQDLTEAARHLLETFPPAPAAAPTP